MSNVPADSVDTFGKSRLANGQPTFPRSAARRSPDRQADIQRRQKSERKVWGRQRKDNCSASQTPGKRAAEGTGRERANRGKKRDVPLWTATLRPRAARVVMVTEHLIEVRDWEYIETISETERERVLREGNEGGDGQKEKSHPLTRSLSFCLQSLSECVDWPIHPDLEIMSCVLITKRPDAAAKYRCLHGFWCHRYLTGSSWTRAHNHTFEIDLDSKSSVSAFPPTMISGDRPPPTTVCVWPHS